MDTLVVSPTRSEQRIVETAPSITVVTGKELEQKQVVTVADALRQVPGVNVIESGSRGSVTAVQIRGADADQVLVLIDGVRVNSTTLGAYDFSQLTPENIDRIEVLRGWGGTLYGSEAVGGVIQIFTRRGEGPPHGAISAAGGNGSTDREVGEFAGQTGIVSYSAAVSHIHTDGFKSENDDYENTVVNGRLDADLVENGSAQVVFRIGKSDFGNVDSNNFLAAPDPNARQEDRYDVVRASWAHSPLEALRYSFAFSYARDDQHFDDPADVAETSSTTSEFLSRTMGGDGNATLTWLRGKAESTFGLEYENQFGDADSLTTDPTFGDFSSSFDDSVGNLAGYTLHQLFLVDRRLVLTGGVRVDDNQRFGLAVSPSGGVSYLFAATQTRLRATYAQGFKAPSLNQLFFPGFGNPDLDAEHSWEVDAGFDQPLCWRASARLRHLLPSPCERLDRGGAAGERTLPRRERRPIDRGRRRGGTGRGADPGHSPRRRIHVSQHRRFDRRPGAQAEEQRIRVHECGAPRALPGRRPAHRRHAPLGHRRPPGLRPVRKLRRPQQFGL